MDIVLKVQYKGTCPHMFDSVSLNSDGSVSSSYSNNKVIGIRWKDITPVQEGFIFIRIYNVPKMINYWEE